MKKLLSILLVLMLALFALTACGCDHLDKNDDGFCDECGDDFWDGKDLPDPCAHRDADDNGKCDKCGETYTDGKDIFSPCEHKDENKDHACDYNCGQILGVCEDKNKDGKCDYGCGKSLAVVYSEGLDFVSNGDGTCYVSGIGACTDTDLVIPPISPLGDHVIAIGEGALAYCDSLSSLAIPDSVTTIGSSAFLGCRNLTSVVIGDSVMSIGYDAFEYCYKIVEVVNHASLDIRAGSEDYGYVARHAKEVHTGESKIDRVGDYLFYTYKNVHYLLGYVGNDTKLTLSDSYKGESYEIYGNAFSGADFTSVVIGDSVTTIGDYAFWHCDSLTSVVIGDSVTTIGDSAFCECRSLTSVVIGNGVKSIGNAAFFNCGYIKIFKYRGTEEQWNAISKAKNWSSFAGSYTITYEYDGE